MAALPTLLALAETWDETTIAGTMEANLIDNYQQEHKRAIRERFAVDHYAFTTEAGKDNLGGHKVIHLLTQVAAHPLALVDAGELYTLDVAGVAELWWQDELENRVQLTTGGKINAVTLTGDYTITGLITFSQFPIGPSAAPTLDYQLTNKKYVDDQITAAVGAIVLPSFGPWEVRAEGVVYQAATDGFAIGYGLGVAGDINGFTDSANPPTINRVVYAVDTHLGTVTMPVRKGDYYRITSGTPLTMFWIPLG